MVPDLNEDLSVRYALGWLHWLRHLALPERQRQDDAQSAIQLLRPFATVEPESIPEAIRELFANDALCAELTNRAFNLIDITDEATDPATLQQAVNLLRGVVSHTPSQHPDRANHLAVLSGVLLYLFAQGRDPAALQEAVHTARESVATTPPDHPDWAMFVSSLGVALQILFEWSGDSAVLAEAVKIFRDAVTDMPFDHPNRAGMLTNLGGTLQLLFEQCGDPALLEEAIQASRDAVVATPSHDSHGAATLSMLCMALRMSFEHDGDLAALREAIKVGWAALAAAPLEHGDRVAGAAAILSGTMHILFERRGDFKVLEQAVGLGRVAVAASPPDHADRAGHLSLLGIGLGMLFEQTADPAILQEAIQVSRDAVAATPPDHAQRAKASDNLTGSLLKLFEREGDLAVLLEAIRVVRGAVAATPPDHVDRAGRLFNLGIGLRTLFEQTADLAVLDEGRRVFAATASVTSARAALKVSALTEAAELDLIARDHAHAQAKVEQAVELIPQIASRHLGRSDREHRIRRLAGLASTAAAATIAADDPSRAVELLEQTRGVLLGDMLDIRSDLTELRDWAPDLAKEFDELRQEIDDIDHIPDSRIVSIDRGSVGGGRWNYREVADRRVRLRQAWTDLLDHIRQIPSLAGFLLPPPIDELRRHAADGPIVYVTTRGQHGHALIVSDHSDLPVQLVDLPALTENTAYEQANLLSTAQRIASDPQQPAHERRAAQKRILQVLSWLWETTTEPVLMQLNHTNTPPDGHPWPRIWWCPVEVVTFLPLHAAGHHTAYTKANTVMDRVISSYTPTIRALGHARTPRTRRPLASTVASVPSMVIVAVPDPPNSPPLRGVDREVELLRQLIPTATTLPLPGTTTTHDSVIAALPIHQIAHFACHGIADRASPAESRLILDDHLDQPLTVASIAKLRLDHGGLAYLSACSTTETNPRHADEATHLAAAFQLAGYRAVIATLWPLNDTAAAAVAHDFYTHLTNGGTTPPDLNNVAIALHHTIRQHRDRSPTLPTRWAAYVHAGA